MKNYKGELGRREREGVVKISRKDAKFAKEQPPKHDFIYILCVPCAFA